MSVQDPSPSDALLAAEFAFGLLDPDERLAVEERQRSDRAFAGLCAIWNERATALIDGPDVAPDPEVWQAISTRLPANDLGDAGALRKAVRRWRGVAAGLGVIAAMLGGVVVHQRQLALLAVSPRTAPIVVILTSADRRAIVSVSYDPGTQQYSVASEAFETGKHSPELWVIPADHVPRSLGLISLNPRLGQVALREGARRIAPGVTLAISLEPLGGSKTGNPTGPVVLTGRI